MNGNEFFSFSIEVSGKKTTKYFSLLVRVAGLLILLDRYLLSHFKIKQQVSHILHNDAFFEQVTIEEETSHDDEIGLILRRYLKVGKELVLSSLASIETTSDLDTLLKKLSHLVYQTEGELKSQKLLDVLACSTLDKIAIARILNHFWLYFSHGGSAAPISIVSMPNSPKVVFRRQPPLREWIPTLDEKTQAGRLELRQVDFEDSKKWKAVLHGYLHERPMIVEIEDLNFLESLKSTDDNDENGILQGDIIVARYTIINDFLRNKIEVKVLEIQKRLRQTQAIQLNLFIADAAAQQASKQTSEKSKKVVKKMHSSWKRS